MSLHLSSTPDEGKIDSQSEKQTSRWETLAVLGISGTKVAKSTRSKKIYDAELHANVVADDGFKPKRAFTDFYTKWTKSELTVQIETVGRINDKLL